MDPFVTASVVTPSNGVVSLAAIFKSCVDRNLDTKVLAVVRIAYIKCGCECTSAQDVVKQPKE